MEDRRKILFTDGMSNDFLLIITDAPKEAIENYCRYHNRMMEDGGHFELFGTLKTQYYVKELLDSEIDEKEDIEIIGYDESYNFSQYTSFFYKFIYIFIKLIMLLVFQVFHIRKSIHLAYMQYMVL